MTNDIRSLSDAEIDAVAGAFKLTNVIITSVADASLAAAGESDATDFRK